MQEYLQLLKYGLTNINYVIQGVWSNCIYRFLPQYKKHIIQARRNICNGCPFMSHNYKKFGVYSTIRKDKHCAICKCNIHLKTACLACNCGLEEFNKKNESIKQPLKWTKA